MPDRSRDRGVVRPTARRATHATRRPRSSRRRRGRENDRSVHHRAGYRLPLLPGRDVKPISDLEIFKKAEIKYARARPCKAACLWLCVAPTATLCMPGCPPRPRHVCAAERRLLLTYLLMPVRAVRLVARATRGCADLLTTLYTCTSECTSRRPSALPSLAECVSAARGAAGPRGSSRASSPLVRPMPTWLRGFR